MAFAAASYAALPYAAGFEGTAYVSLAWVAARNAIDVLFSRTLLAEEASVAEDALNLSNWTLSAVTPGAVVPRVQLVEAYDDGRRIRVIFDARLTDDAEYQIEVADRVNDAAGFSVGGPRSADVVAPLLGFVPVLDRVPREVRVDLRSTGGAERVSGTLRYDETGDLANESGRDYLKKRILRRVTTARGAIFHLPDYGAGRGLKQTLTPAFLAGLRASIRAQVLLEPDVRDASVAVTRLAPNVIRVSIRPTSVDGELLPEITTAIATE